MYTFDRRPAWSWHRCSSFSFVVLCHLIDDVVKTLPAPANELADCETNPKCLLSKLGLNDVAELIEPASKMFNILSHVKTMFIDVVEGLQCSKWGTQTVPITSVVSKLGIELPGEVCDIDVPYCEGEFSTLFIQAAAVAVLCLARL